MLTKILAAIVLWIFGSLIFAIFIHDGRNSFLQAWTASAVLIFIASLIVVILDYVIPWAFTTLFG